jgi:hypothetical protein
MTRLLLCTATVLALIGMANAAEVPKDTLGVWCTSDQPGEHDTLESSNDQRSCHKQSNKNSAIMITIKPSQYIYQYEPNTDGFAYTCNFTAIATRLDYSGGLVATFAADCKEDAAGLHYGKRFRCTWQERGMFFALQKDLYFDAKASVRKGNERCERAG